MLRCILLISACLLSIIGTKVEARSTGDRKCAAMARSALNGAHILSSEVVAAGSLQLPASTMIPDFTDRLKRLPAFCRIQAFAAPSPESRVGIEVWLPLTNWNGRLLGTGNGGGAGSIMYEMGMVEGLQRGFAVANTDMGTAPDISTVAKQPERWIDFGHRATHEMTRVAKAIVGAYYKAASFRSYFAGCSTGGQQALSAAQRYPHDYDGILAGAPGNNRTHVATSFVWNHHTLTRSHGAALTAAQWSLVSRAVISACAGKDGGALGDKFLTDPRQCRFDPAMLPQCKASGASDQCLTPDQLVTVKRIHAGTVNPRTGERIYPGVTLGSEDQMLGPLMQGGKEWPAQQFYLFDWALGADFSVNGFDFDRDMDRVDARLAGILNANQSDLGEFARRGGKLLLYSGIADPAVPFEEVVHYYDRVVNHAGSPEAAAAYARLFLVPGMGHCLGGPGASEMGQPAGAVPTKLEQDALMALVAWTEQGTAPDWIIATRQARDGITAMNRPVCAYPALPAYRGGDPAKHTSFTCTRRQHGVLQAPAARYLN